MSVETDRRLRAVRATYPEDTYVGDPADPALVAAAERALGVIFPPSYREFLARYGLVSLSPNEIYGLTRGDRDRGVGLGGAPSAVGFTLRRRADQSLPSSLVVLVNSDGVEYDCLDTAAAGPDGECPVVRWNVPTRGGVTVRVAPSFDAFLGMMLEEFEASMAEV